MPFLPSSAGAGGWTGIGLAMTYGVLSHVGIEEGATLGHEAKDPKGNIPRGLWIAAIIIPLFYIFISYALVYGYGIDNMSQFGADDASLQTLGLQYWGRYGLAIVSIAAISSILAFSQAAFIAGARVLYTLGHERVFPNWLGHTSKRQTPHRAVFAMCALSILLGVPLALITGPFNVWGYFGFLISIAFLVSYVMTNVGMIIYMQRIGEFQWFRHGVLGILGTLIFLYPLYRTVWPLAPGVYGVLPFVYIAWLVAGVVFLWHTRMVRPGVIDSVGSLLAEEEAA